MIAAVILLVGVVGVASLFGLAVAQNHDQGDVGTRTTEYAQDKMEQLRALGFTDGATDTTVYPSAAAGGTGLGGVMAGSSTVGSTDPAAPTASYVDYLDVNGTLTNAAGAFYTRAWSITTNATGNLKTITVVVSAKVNASGTGTPPSSTLVCSKTNNQ